MSAPAGTAVAEKRIKTPSLILNGVLPLDRANLPRDIVAGITLAALGIPEVMGYTKIAGTPVVTGLYTILLPIAIFAIFGSSRHLVVGADSATAAVMAAGLVGLAAVGSSQYIQLASLSALLCAALLVVARLLRLGFIANFLSRSVLIGFLTGVGIQVAMGQVGGIFGVPSQSGNTIEKFVETLKVIPSETSVPTLVVSLVVLGTIVGLERVNKRIPGALIAVVGMIVLSYALDFASRGITELGTVPGGLPAFGLPTEVMTAANVAALLPVAISMVVIILAQSAATSRAYAMKYRDRFDENVDLIGLGLANAAAGISGTFVVNGSPTKTEMVDSAGGRTQIAGLTTAVVVLVVLLFLTGPLGYMPNAVLSSVVFLIGLRLIDIKGMRDIARLRPGELAVAGVTAAVVVAVGVEQGIILAMFLSILEHISHSYKPYDRLLKRGASGELVSSPLDSGTQAEPGLIVYRFGSSIYYANATRFTEEIVSLVEDADPPARWVCLDASAVGDVDYSGSETLGAVHEELKRQGVTLVLVHVDDVRSAPPGRLRADRADRCLEPVPDRHGRDGGLPCPRGAGRPARRERPADARGRSRPLARSPAGRRRRGSAPRSARGLRGLAAGSGTSRSRRAAPAQATHRIPELVPIRHSRMAAGPFPFLPWRSAADGVGPRPAPHHGDQRPAVRRRPPLQLRPVRLARARPGLRHQRLRRVLAGPWEWDLLRLAASIAVAARSRSFSAHAGRHAVHRAVRSYGRRMHEYAAMRAIDVYYARVDAAGILAFVTHKGRPTIELTIRSANTHDALHELPKLTDRQRAERRIVDRPPVITHPGASPRR